ncbi:hypothetical protein DM860_006670 [Cuscuta australis]|uniref:Uncharacterized protein n=1 Tax=Cuscuta australis TaxID=267555 RepID=A0A328D622_9ASTE|nr:hypothetical protein DM860_006670 [Cuscuta australis]
MGSCGREKESTGDGGRSVRTLSDQDALFPSVNPGSFSDFLGWLEDNPICQTCPNQNWHKTVVFGGADQTNGKENGVHNGIDQPTDFELQSV